MANTRVERHRTEDQRRSELRVEEIAVGNSTERVTTHLEEKVPMEVRRVVRETIVPVVTARHIDEYEDGKLVNSETEVVPDHALNLAKPTPAPITLEDIRKIVREAVGPGPESIPDEPVKLKRAEKKARLTARQVIENRMTSPRHKAYDMALWFVLAALVSGIVWFGWLKAYLGR
jgi:hypothetical protein